MARQGRAGVVRGGIRAAVVALAAIAGGCASDRQMLVMVRDAETESPIAGADVAVRTTQGTSTSRFDRVRTLTGEDGSVLIEAPVREAIQVTVETDDGSYGRFVIDHPALGVTVPWTRPGVLGYERGPRRFQISAIEWEGGKSELSPRVKWREPTPARPVPERAPEEAPVSRPPEPTRSPADDVVIPRGEGGSHVP